MDIYKINEIGELIKGNSYVGRGIILGESEDGRGFVSAYFIMGRSVNSRNRIFAVHNGALFTEPYDASMVADPRLIIYAAMRVLDGKVIVTNGDQTDTIYNSLKNGGTFEEALGTREFEPDVPNLTPRISGIADIADRSYKLSILKSVDDVGSGCTRQFFEYPAVAGLGHFIHTYVCDGTPIPSFVGEPKRVKIPSDIDLFANDIWEALDSDNKISLYVRYDGYNGTVKERIINKNK